MATPTVIGRGTFIRGRVSGSGDLEIAGRIEGDVECTGEVVVETGGLVGAGINARRIIVRGAVKGDLVAEEAVLLEAGARVVGDLRAPRIAIAPGGLVRGHVQTGAAGPARPRAASATASRSSSTTSRASTPTQAARPAARSAPAAAPAPAPAPAKKPSAQGKSPPRGATLAGTRVGPPAPVVPALKKGTKATKKAR